MPETPAPPAARRTIWPLCAAFAVGAALASFAWWTAYRAQETPTRPAPATAVPVEEATVDPLDDFRAWQVEHPLSALQDPLPPVPPRLPSAMTATPDAQAVSPAVDGAPVTSLLSNWLAPLCAGRRVVIAIDISSPVAKKLESGGSDMHGLALELRDWLASLPRDTHVTLLQFSRTYAWASPHLRPLSLAQSELTTWLEEGLVTNGRPGKDWTRGNPDGIESVLTACRELQPEVVVLISDASFQSTTEKGGGRTVPWETLTATWQHTGSPPPPCLIGLCIGAKPSDLQSMDALAQSSGGWARHWVPARRP